MGESGTSAVVLGAGMAGLLAARVVSEFYDCVTVVDRDQLPDHPVHRKGVPQGRHLHSFLSAGTNILGELFPGILAELATAGAVVIDNPDLSGRYARLGRHELNRTGRLADPTSLAIYSASRPLLEFQVRRRVDRIGNVAFLDGHDAIEPVHHRGAVTGVRVTNQRNRLTQVLPADLVVDATGRASRTTEFLTGHGFGCVPEQRRNANWGYSSQLLRIPPDRLTDRLVFVNRGRPAPVLLLVAYEHDTWMLAIARSDEQGAPPSDFTAMLAAAKQLLPADIMAGLRDATPMGELAVSRDTGALWHRYDRMPRMPAGLVVTGDGLCRLNPLHGQGMTMAALEAVVLRDCLRERGPALPQRFFRAAAGRIAPVWAANAAADHPSSPDHPRPLRHRLGRWFAEAAGNAAARDIVVTERLLRVRNLVDPPSRLRDPALMGRILLANLRGDRQLTRPLTPESPTGTLFSRRPSAGGSHA
ncbi:FAD-dependent oxidoreductase [Mycobacterium sp. pW045]|uniref:FAD-dependent oxidoreductase n=1 Tax=Mycobacterium sp. pW045 TaxID=3238984 RepID=UPI00351BC394